MVSSNLTPDLVKLFSVGFIGVAQKVLERHSGPWVPDGLQVIGSFLWKFDSSHDFRDGLDGIHFTYSSVGGSLLH